MILKERLSTAAGLARKSAFWPVLVTALIGLASARPLAQAQPTPGSRFFTVTPCRMGDTRLSPPLVSGTVYTVTAIGPPCGIPSGALAVALNVIVVNSTGGGYLTLYSGATVPGVSTLNFSAGQTRANNAIVNLDASGAFNILASLVGGGGTLDVVVDTVGYFVALPLGVDDSYQTPKNTPLNVPAPGVLGNDVGTNLQAVPINGPTFNGTVNLAADGSFTYTPTAGYTGTDAFTYTVQNAAGSSTATVNLTISCLAITVNPAALPGGTAGTGYSQTISATGGTGPYGFTVTSGSVPTGLTLDPATGVLSGTPTAANTFSFTVTATDANACTGATAYSVTIVCPAIAVSPSSLPAGSSGVAYSPITFTQTGGVGAVTFSQTGALPTGMSFSGGVLSGTPTQTGSFPITVTATDSNGCQGSHNYTLVVSCVGTTITVNPTSLPGMTSGTFTTTTFTASGGAPAYTFSQTGALPTGLSFLVDTLSGTPTQTGTFPITILATDDNGCQGSRDYLVVISCVGVTIAVSPGTLSAGSKGSLYAPVTFSGSGGTSPYSFSEVGVLPTGMSFSGGVLSGTPTQSGAFPITVAATDAASCAGSQDYTLTINEAPLITSANNATFTVGSAGTFAVTTTGFPRTSGAMVISETGSLPGGVSFTDNGDGSATLAGTPAALSGGTYPITIGANNGVTPNDSQSFTLTVNEAPNITSANNTTFPVGQAGTFTVTTTGFPTGTSMVITKSGALPLNVTFTDNGDGSATLAGTPNAGTAGAYPITITANNGVTPNGTQNFTLTVTQAPAITSANTVTFAPGKVGQTFNVTTTGFPTNVISRTGTLPLNVTFTDNLNNTATIAGTPVAGTQAASPYLWVITAANGVLPDATQNPFTFNVVCPAITVSGTIPALTFNTAMATATFTQVGGNGTIAWSQAGLPTGTGINSSTGDVTGTPSVTGTFSATITATDAGGCVGTKNLTVIVAPVATNDSYNGLVDNTQFVVTGGTTGTPGTPVVATNGAVTFRLTNNDLPSGGVSLTTGTFVTAAGGSVTIAADGTFIYTPKANPGGAATTSDSFTYTISSNTGATPTPATAIGTATLTLAGRVWYVLNNGGAGNGQSQAPFNLLSAAIAASTTNDNIFVYRGDGTTANLATASILKAGQKFIGEGAALVVNGNNLVAAGSFPVIGNTVTLATNVTVNGIDMSTGSASGLVGTSVAVLSVTVRNITTTSGEGINWNGVTSGSTVTFNNVNSTSGGAVDITSSGATDVTFNDVTSTTGTAVKITTASGDFTFHGINANGATTGISVSSATGTFTVNGTGSTDGSGGTVQNATKRGADFLSSNSITLKNMNFIGNGTAGTGVLDTRCADALNQSTTSIATVQTLNCQANVYLQSTTTVVLNNVKANQSKAIGIFGNNVTGLTLTSVEAQQNGDELLEDGVQLVNQHGTVTVTGGTFRDNASRSFEIQNNSGTPTLNITGGTFGNTNNPTGATTPSTATAGDTILLATNGTNSASIMSVIKGATFSNIFGRALNSNTEGNTSQNVSFGQSGAGNGNTVSNVNYGTDINGTTSGSVTYSIVNNTFTNTSGAVTAGSRTVINARKGFGATGNWTGTVSDNTIGTSGVTDSGCDTVTCGGISLDNPATSGNYDMIVTNNTVYRVNGDGIFVANNAGGSSTGTVRARIEGNNLLDPEDGTLGAGGNQGEGVFVAAIGAGGSINVKVGGSTAGEKNTVTGNWHGQSGGTLRGVRFSRGTNTTFCISGYSGPFDSASVGTFITSQNTGNAGSATQSLADGLQFTGPICPTP
jgi:hypothetical protein